MDAKNIDKSVLRAIIREIIKEDISLFKDTIKEILAENQIIVSNEQKERRERLEKLIDDDFKKYGTNDVSFNVIHLTSDF